jgi:hypothetical protein
MLSGAISLVSYCHHHLVNNLSPVLIVFAVIYWLHGVISLIGVSVFSPL